MGWLGLKKRPTREEQLLLLEQQALAAAELEGIPPLGPVLSMLVPDVAGVTSFHLLQFHSTGDAAEYLGSLPAVSGVHAFWAMHEPPSPAAPADGAEAMVLIRSTEGSETVYVVSFVDLESAQSFARFEVRRGMSLSLLLIYWAEIVEITVDESGICFNPESPPLANPIANRWDTTPDVQATATETRSPLVVEPEPEEPEPETAPEPEPAIEDAAPTEPEFAEVDDPAPEPEPALEPAAEQSPLYMNGSSERGTAGIDPTDLVVAEPAIEEMARTRLEEEASAPPDADITPEEPESETAPEPEPAIEDAAPTESEFAEVDDPAPEPEPALEPAAEQSPLYMNGSSERGTAGIDPTDLVVAEPALEEMAHTHLEEEASAPPDALEPEGEQFPLYMNGSSERGTAGIDPADLVAAEPALEEVARTHLEEELDIEREARAFLDATVQEIKEVQIEEPPTQVEEAPGPEVIAAAIDLAPEAAATEAEPVAEPVVEEIEQTAPEPEPMAVAKREPIVEAPQTEPQETVAVAPARNGRHAADLPPPLADEDAADLVGEVERILQVKRWDKRKNPFRGFDSPPGRF